MRLIVEKMDFISLYGRCTFCSASLFQEAYRILFLFKTEFNDSDREGLFAVFEITQAQAHHVFQAIRL